MGGGRFAQGLAALAVIAAPIFLVFHHWLTMNAFEPLIWMACALCVVRAINNINSKYWLWFGVLAGLGLETKYSVIFFAFGIVVGLILTSERRFLTAPWIWLGGLIALLIFLPNMLWQARHGFPFLELMSNIRQSGRDVVRGPLAFITDQGMIVNPILFPLWAGGLVWLFFDRQGRRYRLLGWTYVVMLVSFILMKGKNYYLAPAYPILFAAGAIAFERITERSGQEQAIDAVGSSALKLAVVQSAVRSGRFGWRWTRWLYVAIVIFVGAALTPLSLPILPVETYIRYQKFLGFEPPKAENQKTGPLPQHFADEFGWEDMTRAVAEVYNKLPPDERARTAIFANSYGQAGAIDYFGPKYGLPKAISNHQNYWYWGPRDYNGEIVIVLGSDGKGDREHFKTVEVAGSTYHRYSRLDEHFDILLCRGLNQNLQILWPSTKKWN
jgi:hypothetical protein